MDDVELILVHGSDNYGTKFESAQALLDDKDITIPVVEKGSAIAVDYGVRGFPTLVVVDKNGNIAHKKMTAVTRDSDREGLVRLIEELR